MSTKFVPKSGLVSLFVAAALWAPTSADAKDLKAVRQHRAASDVTGAIEARSGGLDAAAAVVSRARAARVRFSEARAAMEHGLLLRETPPKIDVAAIQSHMKILLDDLAVIEQMNQSRFAGSAKQARRLADEWYQSGMKILAPPEQGVTDMPLPIFVKSKGDAVATAIDHLVDETAANRPTAKAPAVFASAPANVAAPKSAASMKTRHVSRKALLAAAPKPLTQNEASLRVMRESLPLFLPVAGPMLMQQAPAAKQ